MDGEWHPAESVAANLSGLVQFRVCLAKSGTPAPVAVFAIHKPDPNAANAWLIGPGTLVNSSSPSAWIYLSPAYQTAACWNGNWDAWCQIVYPEPPGGDQPASVAPLPESTNDGAASLASWQPPGYGWPPGFPVPDQGNNDIYAGPGTVTAKNLVATHIDAWGADSQGVVAPGMVDTIEPFVATKWPERVDGSTTYQDGLELGDPPWADLVVAYMDIGYGPVQRADHAAPCTVPFDHLELMCGRWGALGYAGAGGSEQNGDATEYLSSHLVTSITPGSSHLYCTGPRRAYIRFQIGAGDAAPGATITDHRYVLWNDSWLELSQLDGQWPISPGLYWVDTDVLAWPVSAPYVLGATLKDSHGPDDPLYHDCSHNRWSRPGSDDLAVPSCSNFASWLPRGEANDVVTYAYSILGHVVSHDPQRPYDSFYSGRHVLGEDSGPVLSNAATKQAFLTALCHDKIVHYCGHGDPGVLYVRQPITPENTVAAADVVSLEGVTADFVMLTCCNGLDGDWSVGKKLEAEGVTAIVGYTGHCWFGDGGVCAEPMDTHIWQLMCAQAYSVAAAVTAAKAAWWAWFDTLTEQQQAFWQPIGEECVDDLAWAGDGSWAPGPAW